MLPSIELKIVVLRQSMRVELEIFPWNFNSPDNLLSRSQIKHLSVSSINVTQRESVRLFNNWVISFVFTTISSLGHH